MMIVRQMRLVGVGAGLLLMAAGFAGCASDSKCEDSRNSEGCSATQPAGSFESDLPESAVKDRQSGADAAAPTVPGATGANGSAAESDDSSASPERSIVEADVIQLQGDRLYTLSRVAGLAILDVSDPAKLKIIGRYRELPGQPFEMYLRGEVAVLMFQGWGQYAIAEDGSWSYVSASKVVALDVSDPAAIEPVGDFDVPGTISDSRVVGDVLYVAGYEDGYCWRCEANKPTTSVSSLDLKNPRAITKVDELRYADVTGQYSWQRSISVTAQRIYIAGPEYGQNGPIGSTIQVVDISSPTGMLVEGAVLQAHGQILSRWQMDEYDGVLRVVSQVGSWDRTTTDAPRVQTFRIVSSKQFEALGQTRLVIPARETLRSARFDGPRAYVITAEQMDPLFTIDLSDPAKPRQVGELEMPGFVYHMEPRGDRVLGLGFEQGNAEGSIAVSLFDVSDLSKPTMLSRVNFGGTWGQLPEDQDRIHKVFRVLEDLGLILVPYSGYQVDEDAKECGGRSLGGVQLMDYRNDTLTLRGSADSPGETRRALVHRDHLLSVSDQRIESFSIADRDVPKKVGQSILASHVINAQQLDDGIVARVTTPDWDGRYFVEFVAAADAEDANARLSELSLEGVIDEESAVCRRWWSLTSVHAEGSTLFVHYEGWSYDNGGSGEQLAGVIAIDASNPSKPKVASKVSWSSSDWNRYYGGYDYGDFSTGEPFLWHGNVLALLESRSDDRTGATRSVRLRLVDLRDPQNLASRTLLLGSGKEYSNLIADGDRILTSHFDVDSATGTRARFYVDAFDVSDPSAPRTLPPVNVPGSLVQYDRASGRAITSQLHRVSAGQLTYSQCYERFANAHFEYPTRTPSNGGEPIGLCTGFEQSLHLVALSDTGAVLEDSLRLSAKERVSSFAAGDGVLFAALGRGGYYGGRYPGGVAIDCAGPCGGGGAKPEPLELLVLGGFGSGELEIGRLTVESESGDDWRGFWGSFTVYADGTKALLQNGNSLAIVDGSTPREPRVERTLPLVGSVYSTDIRNGAALLALGQQGVQWVEL